MLTRTESTPAFGQADLSNCEREQIHLAGSIQSHGALLLLREPHLTIVQASANAAAFLGVESALLGRRLPSLGGDARERLQPHLRDPLDKIVRGVRCSIGRPAVPYEVMIHRPPNGGLLLEIERVAAGGEVSRNLESALHAITAAGTIGALCDEAAHIFKALVGYDRVMIYRFDEQGHGEVFSEQREPSLDAYLGNRYPASDIPQIARRLYERNRVRVLVDVEYTPVPLTPPLSPLNGEALDMSLCSLRSSSPIHVQYLKNMGVRATLVASLLVSGRLWGLVSCHHYAPRSVAFEQRAMCELLSEAVATRIAALESFAQAQAELSVRRLEQRMIRAISRDGDWRGALFDRSEALLEAVPAGGAALLYEGEIRAVGEVPSTSDLRDIGRWLDRRKLDEPFVSASLADEDPEFATLTPVASGLLAARLSTMPGEYLIWVRPERVRTETWGGNPFKPPVIGDGPGSLSPRRSFAQWQQVVKGTSDPWSLADLAAARLTADTVSDVIIQFRAVRVLFAENQRDRVRRQVEASVQPVVVADAEGRILKMNSAFADLLPPMTPRPQKVAELLPLFTQPEEIRNRLQELLEKRVAWRGEVRIIAPGGGTLPVLVRADPVFTSPDQTLGFVLLCTDLTERKQAEAARRAFQEGVVEQRRPMSGQLNPKADLMFRNHISAIVENAQLAALEIADRVDPARMAEMLEAVRASVARTAEVLRYLVWHATERGTDDEG